MNILYMSTAELSDNRNLFYELQQLLKQYYEDPAWVLAKGISRSKNIYIGFNMKGCIECFAMINFDTILAGPHTPLDTMYFGLCAASKGQGSSVAMEALTRRCLLDGREWEVRNNTRLVLWATTASPSIYYGASKLWSALEPAIDGSFTERGAFVARAISAKLNVAPLGIHPFVLKKIAIGTKYNNDEQQRIDTICKTKRFSLFEQLGVFEAEYDRLLLIGAIPEDLTPLSEPRRDLQKPNAQSWAALVAS